MFELAASGRPCGGRPWIRGAGKNGVRNHVRPSSSLNTDPQDAPWHVRQVVRRMLLRRNIAIDAEAAQLGAADNPAPWHPAAPAQRSQADQLLGRRAHHQCVANGRIVSRPPGKLPAPPSNGQVCPLFAADIAGFTAPERDDEIRLYLHEELYKLLERAFDGAGIPWNRCFREDRGDGVLTVIPPGMACKKIIDPLPERLRGLIRRHNHVFRDAAAIQLRIAAHIGPVDHDGHGFIGSDINLLFRMLNARPLKRALTSSGAELALIISDYLYRQDRLPLPQLDQPRCLPASQVPRPVHQYPSLGLSPSI